MDTLRRSQPVALELLESFRALVINGPRQAGKSTLVRHVQHDRGVVANLDDASLRNLARTDPIGFLAQLPPRSAIDEFQRGGNELLLALKMAVDGDRTPGQFILAGSTRFLTTRTLSETLTGRVGILDLLPLSAGELRGRHERFVQRIFDPTFTVEHPDLVGRAEYAEMVANGGFPELALGTPSQRFRTAWCSAYVRTVTAGSNIDEIADVRRPDVVAALLSHVAVRSSGEVVIADLARELAVDQATVRSYLDVLATLYLIRLVPGWTTSQTNRAKRRPVMHFIDTALACHLIGTTSNQLAHFDSPWFGPLLESYVVSELAKQAGWGEQPITISHYCDRDQREVDVILEQGQDIVGIEIKATATPTTSHAKHLAYLRDRVGKRFRTGIVLHTGAHTLALSDRILAAPVSALWSG